MVHPHNGAVPVPYRSWLQSILGLNFKRLQLLHQVVSGHLVGQIPQHHGRPHLRVDSRSVVAKASLYDFSAVVTEEAPILVTSQKTVTIFQVSQSPERDHSLHILDVTHELDSAWSIVDTLFSKEPHKVRSEDLAGRRAIELLKHELRSHSFRYLIKS